MEVQQFERFVCLATADLALKMGSYAAPTHQTGQLFYVNSHNRHVEALFNRRIPLKHVALALDRLDMGCQFMQPAVGP